METEDSAFRARFAPKAAHGKGTGKASKGFIFSIDATLGLFVLVLFLVSIVFISSVLITALLITDFRRSDF